MHEVNKLHSTNWWSVALSSEKYGTKLLSTIFILLKLQKASTEIANTKKIGNSKSFADLSKEMESLF